MFPPEMPDSSNRARLGHQGKPWLVRECLESHARFGSIRIAIGIKDLWS